MKAFMTGGTGFVGKQLADRLVKAGHEVTVLTRGTPQGHRARRGVSLVQGDPTRPGPWQEAVNGQDVIINLAGTSIFGRWTARYKRSLVDSRIATTRNLVEAIPSSQSPTFFSASAVGVYGFHQNERLDESAPAGEGFLARLAADWEAEALAARDRGARVVITRFGIVLGRDGGALRQMLAPFRFYLGGPMGKGLQWFSWIHIEDLISAFVFLLGRPDLDGPFNLTAPKPVQNREFARALGNALGRPAIMPAPAFLIRLVLGEFGSVILKGQRVLPKRLLDAGFEFKYPDIELALGDLLR